MIPLDTPLFVDDFNEDEKLYWEAPIVFDLPVTSIDFGFDMDSVENRGADESVDWEGIFDLVDCYSTIDVEWFLLVSWMPKVFFC